MPLAEEALRLDISVLDNFSDDLRDLKEDLSEIAVLEGTVSDIDIDVDVDGLGQVEALDAELKSLNDRDIDIGVDTGGDIFDTTQTPFTEDEMLGVMDFMAPFTQNIPLKGGPSARASGGGGSAAVGDGDGDSFLGREDIRNIQSALGEAFDESVLTRRGGEITSPSAFLSGSLSDRVDTEGVMDAFMSGEMERSTLAGLTGRDTDDFLGSLSTLRGMDLVDLPERRRGILSRFADLELKMGDFFKVLAGLIPLLGVFVGALPAAIAGVLGLAGAALAAAGALGAVGGLAILGMGLQGGQFSWGPIQQRLTELRNTFVNAFGPIAERFAPLAADAFRMLDALILDLARQSSVLLQFRDDFRGLIQFVGSATPQLLTGLAQLAGAMMPTLRSLGQFVLQADPLSELALVMAQTLPLLGKIGASLASILPVIIDLSVGFLLVATTVVYAFDAFFSLLNVIPFGAELFGVLVGTLFTLVSVVSLFGLTVQGLTTVMGFFAGSTLVSTITSLEAYSLSAISAAISTWTLYEALAALVSLTGVGLAVVGISQMVSQVGALNSRLSDATKNLRGFDNAATGVGGPTLGSGSTGTGAGGGSLTVYEDNRSFDVNAPDRETGSRTVEELRYTQDVDHYFSG